MLKINDDIQECTPGSFLSRLWRVILIKDGYVKYIHRLINSHISKLISKSLTNKNIIVNRTNINNKIIDSSMTWRNLMFLLKEILLIKELETSFDIKYNDKDYSLSYKGMTNNILSLCWEELSKDLDLDKLAEDYLNRDNPLKINKTNLNKKLEKKSTMTFKNLMFILEEVLLIDSIKLSMKLKDSRNLYSTHSITYNIKG